MLRFPHHPGDLPARRGARTIAARLTGRAGRAGLVIGGLLARRTAARALAESPASPNTDWGALLIPARAWTGVDVYANRGDEGYLGPDSGFGYCYQCVELVQRFYARRWRCPSHWPVENADEMFATHPDDVTAIPNGGNPAPRWGDVLVFESETLPDGSDSGGHVAVVVGIRHGRVMFVEENNPGATGWASLPIDADHVIHSGRRPPVIGWLHSSRNHGVPPGPADGRRPGRP